MKTFRYDTSAKWFKGNTHLHSTASDGGMSFPEMSKLYATAHYDFLFRTDHWVSSDATADIQEHPLVWIDGVELHGHDHTGAMYHVVCLGLTKGLIEENGLVEAFHSARQQGALLILAHPHWSGNTLDDCLRWPFDGVEIYNHVCHWLNGKSDGLIHWDAMLKSNPNTLALAVDDAHLRPEHPGWNGGWITVNTPECTQDTVLKAIRHGNFYSSCGPEFLSLEWDGNELHSTTSPVRFIRLVGPAYQGKRIGTFMGPLITEAHMTIPDDWCYAYLEIEDEKGRRAWTNSLFTVD